MSTYDRIDLLYCMLYNNNNWHVFFIFLALKISRRNILIQMNNRHVFFIFLALKIS